MSQYIYIVYLPPSFAPVPENAEQPYAYCETKELAKAVYAKFVPKSSIYNITDFIVEVPLIVSESEIIKYIS